MRGAIELTNCNRQVLGFIVAAVVPGLLFGWAMAVPEFLSSSRPDARVLVAFPMWTAFFGMFVTVPTVLLIGIPTYWIFTRHGWTDWPRCLLGGAVIGWMVGLLVFGGGWSLDPAKLLHPDHWHKLLSVELNLGSALLGVASVLMLWSMIYTRRAWLVFAGLVVACPPVAWALLLPL